ncbi:MAG: hypothetical protein QG607_224 [Patescibacteria group bacterium]|nr:hypothetical protein [Patescibacteria group bacterium]
MFNTNKTLKAHGAELASRGVSIEMLAKLQGFEDKDWLDQCAAVMLARLNNQAESELTTLVENNHAWARVIMGTNFLGLEEVEKAFGVKYTANQRQQLATIPFDEATLKACADTHVLIAGFPMSINDIRKSKNVKGNAAKLFDSLFGNVWYEQQSFANVSVEVRWFLLRKKPIDQSTSKTYEEQYRLIPQGEENSWARDVVFATIVLFLTAGERLYKSVYVRCKDVSTDGNRVYIGYFDRFGMGFLSYWGGDRIDCLAVCSVRNP